MDENTNEWGGGWGVAELMGHKVVAGYIQKSEMLGEPMMRVDIPATSAFPAFTQFYGKGALYCVTLVSEEAARLAAEQCRVNPISIYVPDLISKEKHEEAINQLREEIIRLRTRLALPAPEMEDIGEEDIDDDEDREIEF